MMNVDKLLKDEYFKCKLMRLEEFKEAVEGIFQDYINKNWHLFEPRIQETVMELIPKRIGIDGSDIMCGTCGNGWWYGEDYHEIYTCAVCRTRLKLDLYCERVSGRWFFDSYEFLNPESDHKCEKCDCDEVKYHRMYKTRKGDK